MYNIGYIYIIKGVYLWSVKNRKMKVQNIYQIKYIFKHNIYKKDELLTTTFTGTDKGTAMPISLIVPVK